MKFLFVTLIVSQTSNFSSYLMFEASSLQRKTKEVGLFPSSVNGRLLFPVSQCSLARLVAGNILCCSGSATILGRCLVLGLKALLSE